jgi:phage-related protein
LSAARRLVYCGQRFRIAFARDRDGSYPAELFFDQLSKLDQAKLINVFRILADHGVHSNPEKFGDLGDGLYEFKSFQIRMPYAHAQNEKGLILITHGFNKKKDKTPPTEIARARRILAEDAANARIHVITDHQTKRRQS